MNQQKNKKNVILHYGLLKKSFKTDIINRCKKARLSHRDTQIAIMYFVYHYKIKEIWQWLCEQHRYKSIEWDSVYQLVWRIGKKINIKKT